MQIKQINFARFEEGQPPAENVVPKFLLDPTLKILYIYNIYIYIYIRHTYIYIYVTYIKCNMCDIIGDNIVGF